MPCNMCDCKDLVEIELNSVNDKGHVKIVNKPIPYKESLGADIAIARKDLAKDSHSSIFGGSIEIVPNTYRSPTELKCLRQMYCPDCKQRLHVADISYDRLLYCCLPLFPIKCLYKRAIHRRKSGNKVICKICGNNLGYWKQK